MLPHHTSVERDTYSIERGTPESLISFVRYTIGDIDLDLASRLDHNEIICAKLYYNLINPCPLQIGSRLGDDIKTVWCNPPGPASAVFRFWQIWIDCARTRKGAFLAFNIEHFPRLKLPAHRSALSLTTLFLRNRVKYRGCKHNSPFSSAIVFANVRIPSNTLGNVLDWIA